MRTTNEYLDEAKARLGVQSDRQLAFKLGIAQQSLNNLRNRNGPSNVTSIKLAQILDIDPALVVGAANAERSKSPEEREFWENMVRRVEGAIITLFLAFGIAAPSSDAIAAALQKPSTVYYVKRLLAQLARLFTGSNDAARDGQNGFEVKPWTAPTSSQAIQSERSQRVARSAKERRGDGDRRRRGSQGEQSHC